MSKMRVYEIAKEVNMESKVLVDKLQAMGLEVKSHASSIEEGVAQDLIEQLKAERKASIVEKRLSTGVIRRRAKKTKPAAAPAETTEEQPTEKKPTVRRKKKAVVAEEEAQATAEPVETEAKEAPPAEPTKTEPAEDEPIAEQPEAEADAEDTAQVEAETKQKAEKKPAEKKTGYYQAKVIRRATPAESAEKAKVLAKPPPEAKPSGIRVLKVVPGKEGRGHEFIDMSKRDKSKRRTTTTKQTKADLREQLFDAFSPAYVPGFSRRKRLARRSGKKTAVTTPKALKRVIKIESETIAASELARRMGVKLTEVNGKLRDMGEEVDNVRVDRILDLATATLVAQEFEYEVQDVGFKEEAILQTAEDAPGDLSGRPPVVTVMGHVDHGKTSILDAIRKTHVTADESGGITQHIGAYEVKLPQGSITFIDTPGHEAFTAMRARGAGITDIVVLVVAADDGIMPQTVEAIHHAKDADVPIIVAANKIDLPGVNTDRIRQELTEHGLVVEQWGGDTIVVEVSAKTKVGLDELLENILVQSEMLELKSNPDKSATGTVIEARLDRGRGPVATLLVADGSLHKGDVVVMGTAYGKTRMMFDYDGNQVNEVTPGRPVQIQGLNEVPIAGEPFHVVNNEREAKKVVDHRQLKLQQAKSGQTARLNLEDFYEKLQGVEKLELKVVIKADVQGTAEAVKQAVEKLTVPRVGVKVIHHGVGAINETDVNLAAASDAILVGFNVRPDPNAKKLAQAEQLEIRLYKVIYDLTQDIRKAQTGLLPATTKEQSLGRAEVRELFNVPKVGTVAGVSVLDGKMLRGALVRLVRDSVEIHQGKMSSLRRFKEDVREVASGYECGIGIENFNDIKLGDIIEAFVLEEEQPTI
jgi:translation initiation factor IF-2